MRTLDLTNVGFRQAADAWLESRRYHLAPRTVLDYQNYIKTLHKYFGDIHLPDITADMVRDYQRKRRATVSPGAINKECSVITQMRSRIGMPLADYQWMPMPKDYESPGRALTDIEEETMERVFRAAADHPRWKAAALASLLSMKCGAAPCEILSLRLKDITIDPPQITIPRSGAKRLKRSRRIELNDSASWALEKIVARAVDECNCSLPEDYLFPFRNLDHTFDPSKPARGYRTSFANLLRIADIKIRRYDFRHHAVSRALGDSSVPLEGARSYFGWISDKMVSRYYHANLATLRVVAAAIDKKPVQSVDFRNLLKIRGKNR